MLFKVMSSFKVFVCCKVDKQLKKGYLTKFLILLILFTFLNSNYYQFTFESNREVFECIFEKSYLSNV